MPQISRAVAAGFPHHVTQRENYQECVSEDKDEGNIWGILEITLEETSSRYGNIVPQVRIDKWALSLL